MLAVAKVTGFERGYVTCLVEERKLRIRFTSFGAVVPTLEVGQDLLVDIVDERRVRFIQLLDYDRVERDLETETSFVEFPDVSVGDQTIGVCVDHSQEGIYLLTPDGDIVLAESELLPHELVDVLSTRASTLRDSWFGFDIAQTPYGDVLVNVRPYDLAV